MAPLIIMAKANGMHTSVVVTGQHKEMVAQVNEVFDIKADFDLNIMRHNQSLNEVASAVISGLDLLIDKLKPSLVLIQGDTTSALSGALAAYYRKIPIAHIEAGLRTGDLNNPFPEEANRRLISQIATFHFCPTKRSVENLISEGVGGKVCLVGNTVVDALSLIKKRIETGKISIPKKIINLVELGDFILLTCHRRESFGEPLKNILRASKHIAIKYKLNLIIPVHPNPNVAKFFYEELGGVDTIHLIDPVDYPSITFLLANCQFVLTDSGGIQEEAPTFGKPIFIIRKTTERPEGVDAGVAVLVGVQVDEIINAVSLVIDSPALYQSMSQSQSPYGDGNASDRIIKYLTI
jgi:UDP-N-acetylglucosamine 2-epimerase (non-hydrolysing)